MQSKRILKREIVNESELQRFFFNELSEQKIYAESSQPMRAGDPVEVHLNLNPNDIPVPRSRNEFIFHGSVTRMEGFSALIKLDTGHLEQIRELKGVVDSTSRGRSNPGLRTYRSPSKRVETKSFSVYWIFLLIVAVAAFWFYFSNR